MRPVYGLEGSLAQKAYLFMLIKRSEKVASELITVIDDPTIPYKYGSYRYDDEGTGARKMCLSIKDS